MCAQGDTVRVEVFAFDGYTDRWIDRCIAPHVESLTARGVETVGSCCGHGVRGPSILFLTPDRSQVWIAKPYKPSPADMAAAFVERRPGSS